MNGKDLETSLINHELRLKMFEKILGSIHDIVIVLDKYSNIIYVNPAYARFAGISEQQILGRKLIDIEPEARILEVLETGREIINDQSHIKSLNKDITANISPLYDDGKKNIIGVVAIFRDVTEILTLQSNLENIQKAADENKKLTDIYYAELRELRRLRNNDNNMIFVSPSMKQVVELALRVADFDSSVIITGESGVGKNMIAKLIHQKSKRSEKPFIEINCGSIPENLLESELFGYEKGAFTGASSNGKVGLFEVADQGTIFLDEIAELALNLQVKLLKALQEQKFIKIGGLKPIKVDVRIISATNSNLVELLNTGKFRKDLYYRLNVIAIHIPPLRQRKEDIPMLTNHFLNKFNNKYNFEKRMSPEAYLALDSYSWPGNIRELENFIERLLVSSREDVVTSGSKILASLCDKEIPNNDLESLTINEIIPLRKAKELVEIELIRKAITYYGSIRKAAKILGLDHSNIARKIKKYNLDAYETDISM